MKCLLLVAVVAAMATEGLAMSKDEAMFKDLPSLADILTNISLKLDPLSILKRDVQTETLMEVRNDLSSKKQLLMDENETSRRRRGTSSSKKSKRSLEGECPNVTCEDSKFRTADGSCNNLFLPSLGMIDTPLRRIRPNTYDNGVSTFRTLATNEYILPNVRNISAAILVDSNMESNRFTLSLMQWAQFMDHDLAHVPFPSLDCCSGAVDSRCAPIDISGDAFYSQFGTTCMNFVRSMTAPDPVENCINNVAEQMNQVTQWIDGSTVYGSDLEEQEEVRLFEDGLLKQSHDALLPIDSHGEEECDSQGFGTECYVAGDSRVNEQPGLTAIHTLWVREHNRVATELKLLNYHWDDEQLFQETRRIVVAEIQHITYNEWLPIIMGSIWTQFFGLMVPSSGFRYGYSPSFELVVNNEFATAAFRFGHSLVPGMLTLFRDDGSVSVEKLRENFRSPHLIQQDGRITDLVRSLIQSSSQTFDRFITEDLTNHLFQTPQFDFGMDLMSLNIHRGRDHGIATYNTMRQVCGLPRANSFEDLSDVMDSSIIYELKKLYKSVDDIDFFVGGIVERPSFDGLLGFSFSCSLGLQFHRLRLSDRYFYDLANQAGSFDIDQLNEIRKATWARIICDNSELTGLQAKAFMVSAWPENEPVSCSSSSIPSINLTPWTEYWRK